MAGGAREVNLSSDSEIVNRRTRNEPKQGRDRGDRETLFGYGSEIEFTV
ncbi:MAG TPA: hypothetical protein VMF55_01285 [Solirubrobacterales bacterium]|nr:hypothetical protein [Solirubrobacterales bacterium]